MAFRGDCSKGHHDAIAQPEEENVVRRSAWTYVHAHGPPEDSEVAARTAMHHPIFSSRGSYLVHCLLFASGWFPGRIEGSLVRGGSASFSSEREVGGFC